MSAPFKLNSELVVQPAKIKLSDSVGILSDMDDEAHEKLLTYLTSRLKSVESERSIRLTRYAMIDRMISTWQMLTEKDSKRQEQEDVTGRSQALPMNLPVLASHLDDSVAFYTEVFAPQGRDFYSVPKPAEAAAATELASRMNRDTRARKYYKELSMMFRSLLKYNIGGVAVRFEKGGGHGELAKPGNRVESIDMYNYLWDSTVTDVSRIYTDAEWAARVSHKNRLWLERNSLKGNLERVNKVISADEDRSKGHNGANHTRKASRFYRMAPTHAGLSMDGADSKTRREGTTVDWRSYGATLSSDEATEITGFEVIEMYCWLNPVEFGLAEKGEEGESGTDADGGRYSLWRFVLVDSSQVCRAEEITSIPETEAEIPHYLGHLIQDDMKEAQRSNMELLKPFQRFASFLLNIYIASARKNIWGMKGVDPTMFDTSQMEEGDVAGILKSKTPGRDVRTGLMTIDSSTGTQEAFTMMTQVLEVMRSLYPSQALPAQIAGIDRAVKNQVSAVLHGAQRRLHMSCKVVDSDLMGPMRLQCYRNLALGDSEGLEGLDEEMVGKVLGSGLSQLNREAVATEIKELIFALFQNPDSMVRFDMDGLLAYWSMLLDTPTSLGDFVLEQPAPAQETLPEPGGIPA